MKARISVLTKSEPEADPLTQASIQLCCHDPLCEKWTARDQSYHTETHNFTLAIRSALALCFAIPF